MNDQSRPRVLLFEDDGDTATLLKEVLENEGFEAIAADPRASTFSLCVRRPRLIVVDRALGRTTAQHELPEALRYCGFDDVPVLLVSAAVDVEQRAEAIGASAYLAKPFEIDDFAAACHLLTH
jgi:DNA-binding response OmpR family regulator